MFEGQTELMLWLRKVELADANWSNKRITYRQYKPERARESHLHPFN